MALFISLEGPDGSGKSTQARLLTARLNECGYTVTTTREPGGTPLGERLRDLILQRDSPQPTPLAMSLLLAASRAQLIQECIEPALENGDVVIVDRFTDSTLAYQGFGLGVDIDTLQDLIRIATGGCTPEVRIYVDVSPETGLQRVASRATSNRLDDKDIEFHNKVRNGYLQIIEWNPGDWIQVDGNRSTEEVHESIMLALEPFLESGAINR